jgi:uncharacterized protein YbjT (DUF2867 family)
MGKKAIILGASGLIGSKLLTGLLDGDQFTSIKIFVRKKLYMNHEKLIQIITDFDHLDVIKKDIVADEVFCCLGSTKSKTPDIKAYRKIDVEYPLYFAKEALINGATSYHIITALGANPKSGSYYNKLKGEVEEQLKILHYPTLNIYQPSFLTGDRTENRPLENIMIPIMKVINNILIGSLKKYQTIDAEEVAKAMINQSNKNKKGIFVLESDKIKELA